MSNGTPLLASPAKHHFIPITMERTTRRILPSVQSKSCQATAQQQQLMPELALPACLTLCRGFRETLCNVSPFLVCCTIQKAEVRDTS